MLEHIRSPDTCKSETDNSVRFRVHLRPLLVLTSMFFVNFSARIIYAPLMTEIESDLNISHAQGGSLFLLISIGYFLSLLGSGWFAARLTHRKTIILSSSVLGLALLGTAFSTSLWTVRLNLFLLGLAAGLYLPSAITTLTELISSRHWGKAIAFHELAPILGFVATPLLSELVMIWFSWRTVVVSFGIAALLMGWVFARFGRGGDFPGVAPGFDSFKPFFGDSTFWLMLLLFGLAISSSLGIYTMLPVFLVSEHGIERNYANSLVALSRISGLGMTFAGGWVTDHSGAKKTLILVFLLSGITTVLIGIVSGAWVWVPVFLQPMLAVCFFPAGFSALSRIGPSNARNIAVSLTVPFAFVMGGGAVPTLIGFMGDVASFALGIVLVGVLIFTGGLLAGFLNLRDKGGTNGSKNICGYDDP